MRQRLSQEIGRMIRLIIIFVLSSSLFALPDTRAQAEILPLMDLRLPAEQRGSAGSGGYIGHVLESRHLNLPELNLQDGSAGVTAFPAPVSTSTPQASIESRAASASLWTLALLMLLVLLVVIVLIVRRQFASKRQQ